MDEMRLSLTTRFMRGMLARVISRKIKKKYGYKVDICFGEIDLSMIDGKTHLHLNVDVDLNSEEFKKIMKAIEEES